MTDLTIKAENDAVALSKAIRVHFAATRTVGQNVTNTYSLFANDGTDAATVDTDVYGSLDLNKNDKLDRSAGYEWDDRSILVYGNDGEQQVANNASGTDVLADDSDPFDIDANQNGIAVQCRGGQSSPT